jgi:hypothetical protein
MDALEEMDQAKAGGGRGGAIWRNSALRILFAMMVAAVVIGALMWGAKPRAVTPPIASPISDPQQVALAQAQKMLARDFQLPADAMFSSYVTDNNTGAAELGSGIWEAWGKVDFRDQHSSNVHRDWHVAWNRATGRVIYRKLGAQEVGNYAEALGASKAYPQTPDAAD